VGSSAFIEQARIYRKMLGGGMRQAGVIAAAGLIALEKSPLRLHEDHANARLLAEGIEQISGLRIDPAKVRTNIVIFDCEGTGRTAVQLCEELQRQGVWAQDTAQYSVRFVTHCDVDRAGCERALTVLRETLAKSQRRSA
jgi:threonine aldolase